MNKQLNGNGRIGGWVVLLMLIGGLLPGCAFGALGGDWKSQANDGIERHRKRDAAVVITDAAGKPVTGATLHIQQVKKAFPFGAAISAKMLSTPKWQEEFKSHFNYAVFENESKWYANENTRGRITYRDADALLQWCDANGIPVRGHCLFWEGEGGPPSWLAALPADQFKQAMQRRLTDATTHFKGRFVSWDVDNEMLHGTIFADRMGKEVYPWMFNGVRKIDPKAKLFMNEYNILSVDWKFKDVQTDEYLKQIRELIRQGVPIDGIGIQGHLWNEDVLAHPDVIRERLDKVAELGLPIWISEFDVADADEKVRADKLEMMYRTAFGHPAVQGIMMWVFWAGNSWRGPTAALMNQDWTPTEEGKRFESLMTEWTTKADLQSDANGKSAFRGFYGTYHVTIERSGRPAETRTFDIIAGKGAQRIAIDGL